MKRKPAAVAVAGAVAVIVASTQSASATHIPGVSIPCERLVEGGPMQDIARELYEHARNHKIPFEQLRTSEKYAWIDRASSAFLKCREAIGKAERQASEAPREAEPQAILPRGWIGVQIQPVTQDIADSMGLKSIEGALVAQVQVHSPASEAGIESGDVILGVNGERVDGPRELADKVAALGPGKKADLLYWRDGSEKTVSLNIGSAEQQSPDPLILLLSPERQAECLQAYKLMRPSGWHIGQKMTPDQLKAQSMWLKCEDESNAASIRRHDEKLQAIIREENRKIEERQRKEAEQKAKKRSRPALTTKSMRRPYRRQDMDRKERI
jgi:hypothetical protein